MGKPIIKANRQKSQKPKEWPVVVYVWMIGLGFAGYLTGEFVFAAKPHPYHWLLLVIGILFGILIGWLWYRWRGDIKI